MPKADKIDSSSWEDDSEFKTKLKCVDKAFTTKLDSWEIVTWKGDVNTQSAPRSIVETKSAASSGPERTAPQDSKTVIDMDGHFHLMFGRETLFNKEVLDSTVRFFTRTDASGGEGDPGEPTGKWLESKLFAQEK